MLNSPTNEKTFFVENFELRKNGTKNHVPVAVADANATQIMACESETKQFAKTPKKKSKTNINTINDNNNNNKSLWSKKIQGRTRGRKW